MENFKGLIEALFTERVDEVTRGISPHFTASEIEEQIFRILDSLSECDRGYLDQWLLEKCTAKNDEYIDFYAAGFRDGMEMSRILKI